MIGKKSCLVEIGQHMLIMGCSKTKAYEDFKHMSEVMEWSNRTKPTIAEYVNYWDLTEREALYYFPHFPDFPDFPDFPQGS